MKFNWTAIFLATLFFGSIQAFPSGELEKRELLKSVENIARADMVVGKSNSNETEDTIDKILDFFSSGKVSLELEQLSKIEKAIKNMINSVIPTNSFHSMDEVKSFVESIYSNTNGTLLNNVMKMLANSISFDSLLVIHEFSEELSKLNYTNKHEPSFAVHPKSGSDDPSYSISEEKLRGAIGIPSDFEYGNGSKKAVILVPGTASMGGLVYASNYAKLLKDTDFADIVWLNVPHYLLDDVQNNAEYVAYAINYISGITNKNVSIISWSQGGMILQWAFKYWPSTNSKVDNFIPFAPDFRGTDMIYLACPAIGYDYTCTPAIKQQVTDSIAMKTLRNNNGLSAYVPTTSIYTGFDDLVSNEEGTNAPSYIHDIRGVGVSNNRVQSLCPHKPAGSFYLHEGILYNPVGYALVIDALTHDGPGNASRIDLNIECDKVVPDGLSFVDVLATEALIPNCLIHILEYQPKTNSEPPIRSYAT